MYCIETMNIKHIIPHPASFDFQLSILQIQPMFVLLEIETSEETCSPLPGCYIPH